MRLTPARRRYLALAILTVAVAATVLALSIPSSRSSGPNPAVSFSTIPPVKLAQNGIILSAAQGAAPSDASGQAAATAASGDFGGRSILEYHYAHCVDTQRVPAISEDCWAVSLDPTGITSNPPPGHPLQFATYDLVLINPTNDKLIEAAEGR